MIHKAKYKLVENDTIYIHEEISSHDHADDKLDQGSRQEADEGTERWLQGMLVMTASNLFSQICSQKRSGDQTDQPKRSDDNSQ